MTEPKPKMPRGLQIRMTAVAFVFWVLIAICALLVVFAPVLVCYFAKYWVQTQVIDSETLGDAACYASGFTIVASYVTPVGAAIAFLGYGLSICIYAINLSVFFLWFMYHGISFMDRMGARLWIMGATTVLGLLPFVNVLPWNVASIWLVCQNVRREDREARKKYEAWLAEESRKETLITRIRAPRSAADNDAGEIHATA